MKVISFTLIALMVIQMGLAKFHHKNTGGRKTTSKGHGWDYRKNGPSTWARSYPSCGGSKQSPINIITCETDRPYPENVILSHNYQKKPNAATYTMINNGHTIEIELPQNNIYFLRKGSEKYIPMQAHIHFDPITGKGSEHTLNSRKYFAEVHIVHRNAKYLDDTFMTKSDGLFVIGIFVELVKCNNCEVNLDYVFEKSVKTWEKDIADGNSFAMTLITYGKSLQYPGSEINIPSFPLGWLLPVLPRKNAKIDYVNYKGSLTTPPCSEIVDWVVITGRTLRINEKLATRLEKVIDSTKKPMAGNNRPIQDLNDREVYGVQGSI